jgi:hypothetical protein
LCMCIRVRSTRQQSVLWRLQVLGVRLTHSQRTHSMQPCARPTHATPQSGRAARPARHPARRRCCMPRAAALAWAAPAASHRAEGACRVGRGQVVCVGHSARRAAAPHSAAHHCGEHSPPREWTAPGVWLDQS